MIQLHVMPTAEDAARFAAGQIDEVITTRRSEGSPVHIALAGGSTPRRAYEILATLRRDWTDVHLWFGDERVVPLDADDANASMVHAALVAPAAIEAAQVHQVQTQLGAPGARDAYVEELRRLLPADTAGLPVLDLAILGLGEDAHTASLFPGSDVLRVDGQVCAVVEDAPKPPPVRVTLTLDMLNAARTRLVLATGAGKADAVVAALAHPDQRAPASMLSRAQTTWILDAAAASGLDERATEVAEESGR